MTTPESDLARPTSTKLLCVVYAAIAVIALIATWSQNIAHFSEHGGLSGLGAFVSDTLVNAAARSITFDIMLFAVAAAVFMVVEAKRLGIRYVWAYIVGGGLIAISVTFPLFLIARERRLTRRGVSGGTAAAYG